MTDWFKKINAFIFVDKPLKEELLSLSNVLEMPEDSSRILQCTPLESSPSKRCPTHHKLFDQPTKSKIETKTIDKNPKPWLHDQRHASKDKTMTSRSDNEENLKALKKLRELPRGTQVESRIAAIENLLGQHEVFKTLNMLRWPQGVICPHCHSMNVIRRETPKEVPDHRHHYICLDCKDDGNSSDFDDFSGLPISSVHALRQWILCWYLIGFCSINQIAKVLGLSIAEVLEMAKHGSELTELPKIEEAMKSKHEYTSKEKKAREEARRTAGLEDDKRSFSKSPTKPGPKSKL